MTAGIESLLNMIQVEFELVSFLLIHVGQVESDSDYVTLHTIIFFVGVVIDDVKLTIFAAN